MSIRQAGSLAFECRPIEIDVRQGTRRVAEVRAKASGRNLADYIAALIVEDGKRHGVTWQNTRPGAPATWRRQQALHTPATLSGDPDGLN